MCDYEIIYVCKKCKHKDATIADLERQLAETHKANDLLSFDLEQRIFLLLAEFSEDYGVREDIIGVMQARISATMGSARRAATVGSE